MKKVFLVILPALLFVACKSEPVKIGDKIMDEDGRVGQLFRIVPYRSPSERFMCATLSLTLSSIWRKKMVLMTIVKFMFMVFQSNYN